MIQLICWVKHVAVMFVARSLFRILVEKFMKNNGLVKMDIGKLILSV